MLGADIVKFRHMLQQLERAAGAPRADIRLAVQIEQEVRSKIRELGLDPHNTTGHELFRALEERLISDEIKIRIILGINSGDPTVDLLGKVRDLLEEDTTGNNVFVIKPVVLRKILKKLKPKATMKALGYRSMDSMFKHESAAQLLVATQIVESAEWHSARLNAYKSLQVSDFEFRPVSYTLPVTKKWPDLAKLYISRHRHNLISVPELGSVVILPLTEDLRGLAILTIALGLGAFEDIRARCALLKLSQVRPDFGEIFYDVITREPMTEMGLGGTSLSWRLAHWFYGSGLAPYFPDIFDPHLQAEDFERRDLHESLEKLDQALSFWRGNHMLGLLDSGGPVSLNALDVALGVCNGFTYANRIVHNLRESLGRELMGRYLQNAKIHSLLEESLARQLAPELAFDD